jgi:hypothetical protein
MIATQQIRQAAFLPLAYINAITRMHRNWLNPKFEIYTLDCRYGIHDTSIRYDGKYVTENGKRMTAIITTADGTFDIRRGVIKSHKV